LPECGTILSAVKGNNYYNQKLKKTEGAIKNRQSKETDNIGYTGHRQTKQITRHRKLKR
jgi:uncharacterized protein (DUF2164 family)